MTQSVHIIDGRAEAAKVRAQVREGVEQLQRAHGVVPSLAVILVGDNSASRVYVRTKTRHAADVGIKSFGYDLPADTAEGDLLMLIAELNAREDVHGILVQLPLPPQIKAHRVVEALDPLKDVDGFHPQNAGMLAIGKPALVPCTPTACVWLAKTVHPSLRGLETVVLGRSTIVGRPAARLFLLEDCTTTVAHSATRNIQEVARRADILVAAMGRAKRVTAEWIKPGATVIDVGINRIQDETGQSKIVGDVDFASASRVAGAITPVPGGVGPMTVAFLLQNTLQCARMQLSKPRTTTGEVA